MLQCSMGVRQSWGLRREWAFLLEFWALGEAILAQFLDLDGRHPAVAAFFQFELNFGVVGEAS